MKVTTLLLIFLIIIVLDKGLTIANIYQSNSHFPEATKDDYFKVEANPVAKTFFMKFGLWGGTFLYSIFSLLTMFIFYYIFAWLLGERVALWGIFIVYGFVIANNTYFLLKYSEVIS